ncbi:MAG: GWxTD domain-containing protein [Gemmatimonadetes bacterium]|nr:GWxTD domain-containing protein [Gemmatimonadota bacterium]
MRRIAFASTLFLWIASPAAASAQVDVARAHLERGLAFASAGDTTAALAALREAVRRAPRMAEAHYQLARLHLVRASAVESDFKDRLAAENALQKALELDPNNPRYLVELGKVKLKQQVRVDALRLFNRALGAAAKQGDASLLADLHYEIGAIYEMWYEGMAHKHLAPLLRGPPPADRGLHPDERVSEFINEYLDQAPEVEGSGWLERDNMMEHYRAALRHDPGHMGAATRLLGVLYDDGRFTEYLALVQGFLARAPDRAEPYLFLGLGYHAQGRENDATEAFERGLAFLPEEDRLAIEDLSEILRRKEGEQYQALDAGARQEFERRFWSITDPLYLTEANERWLEHIARAVYADLRFAAPEFGLRGWETERGIIYIRYGRPARIAVFAASATDQGDRYRLGQQTIVWTYGRNGPTFIFQRQPGYRTARFAGEHEQLAADYRYQQPAFYKIPSLPVLFRIPVQVARFRGVEPEEAVVEIHAGIPLDSLSEGVDVKGRNLEVGFFLLDPEGRAVERRVRTLPVARAAEVGAELVRVRSWRLILPPDSFYYVGVEARDPLSWRAATARDTFTAWRFERGPLQLSDILLADFVDPITESPLMRDELRIRPNPALRYEAGAPLYVYYEVYDLEPDSLGFATYDVTLAIRVKSITRGGGFAQLLGKLADAWGFSIVGDDRVEVKFSREVKLDDRDRVPGWYRVELQEAPAGEYDIRLEVRDRQSGATAIRARSFTVGKRDSQG